MVIVDQCDTWPLVNVCIIIGREAYNVLSVKHVLHIQYVCAFRTAKDFRIIVLSPLNI